MAGTATSSTVTKATLSLHTITSNNTVAEKCTKSSFLKRRVTLAQQLLHEFDTIAFGGSLLQLVHQEQNSTPTSSLESPNITLKWSNRLRTTAGRAHLMYQQHAYSNELYHCTKLDSTRSNKVKGPKERKASLSVTTATTAAPRRIAVIELSTKVVDDMVRLQSTLLHEMCHAAAWIVDGNTHPPHGPCFQKWVRIATTAIPSISITTKHNFTIHYKFAWTCINPSCSIQFIRRHSRRSIDVKRHVCGKCRGPLQAVIPTNGTNNDTSEKDCNTFDPLSNIQPPMHRPLNEYNRFVQKQTKIVTRQLQQKSLHKKRRPLTSGRMVPMNKVSPQKVMRECARLWQLQKKLRKKK
jgi:predicted SprT family Zn-dependent metalloprotease